MDSFTLLLTAVGLSMDAFAVSISNALCYKNLSGKQAFANSLSFGIFQGVMPVIGFFAGRLLGDWITSIDHWLALVLLGFIGLKMLLESIRSLRKPDDCPPDRKFGLNTMLVQSVGTSIDALAVGISFAALSVNIWLAAGSIAVVTFFVCILGCKVGSKAGALLGDWAGIMGGLILIGIGVKIFIEHTLGIG